MTEPATAAVWHLHVKDGGTVEHAHQAHYRLCGCLGDSAECCDQECACHVLD